MNMAQTHTPVPNLQQRFPERLVQLADGAQLAIRECGQGPVVVLLHGIGSGSASWLHCAQRLAAGNRVIAWDAPGYGLSTPLPPARPKACDYAACLELLLDALGVESCLLVGHSLGALMATAYAAGIGAARVRRLVLLSPARGYGAAELRDSGAQVRRQRLENLERFGIDGMASERTARLLGRNPSEEALAWVRWNMARLNPEGYRQAVELLCGDDLLGNGQPAAPCEVHCGEDDGITTPGVAAPSPASSARRSRRFPGPATPARSNNPKWSQDASATRNASLLKEPPMDKSDDSQDKYIVPGLERGLLLLCEFSRKDRTLTAPELARRLKLPRSTIFRLLTTLEAMGFVTRNGNEYRLGMAVLRLGFEYLASLELTELGQPLLNRLCDEIRYPATWWCATAVRSSTWPRFRRPPR